MKLPLIPNRSPSRRFVGFTLVELLVVIGVIALLISILMPALSKARKQALKTNCMSNLRSIGQALQIYAGENKGKLPATYGGGNWLWDLPIETRDRIISSGCLRKVLYCPSYPEQDVDGLWNFDPNFSVLGYFFLLQRIPPPAPMGKIVPNMPNPLFEKNYQDKTVPKKNPITGRASASETELVTDSVISSNGGNFAGVQGGFAVKHLTSHMNRDNKPEGGNILFMDGHVDWRPFADMKVRDRGYQPEFWF
ncbi:MAG TPA: type II secretion system protein [Tepidisphaeraceae bacterium]|jgi:prepilin-type N-terminal cleavage/methylation domain-containing protein/prepilin-type processing-associated H-X9-DG protein